MDYYVMEQVGAEKTFSLVIILEPGDVPKKLVDGKLRKNILLNTSLTYGFSCHAMW